MPKDSARRPSLRLPTYDYAQPGGYFVTICTSDRRYCFGRIVDASMARNEAGEMVQNVWERLPERFPHIALDAFIVMPNHVHGVVLILEGRHGRGLGQIVGTFKSLVDHGYRVGVREHGWPALSGKLWQDNYFEHVVRDDASLERIRDYILGNPAKWETDPER